MAAAVGHVVELVGPDGAVGLALGDLGSQPAGIFHVIVRVPVRHGRDQAQVGADQPEHVLLLVALRLRHDDDGAIAAGIGHQGQADAGIAGGALDDDAAGAEQAAGFGVLDDRQRRAVLDAAAGIEELALAQDLAAGQLGCLVQADQRRVADQVDEAGADTHRHRVISVETLPDHVDSRVAGRKPARFPNAARLAARSPG